MTTQTPVTEIVTLSLTPTADVAALANTLHTIISRQPGSLETKWGVWEEDRTKLQLMTNWTDLTAHETFMASGDEYTALLDTVTPHLTAPPEIIHVHFRGGHARINEVLGAAAVVELRTFYAVKEGFGGWDGKEEEGKEEGCVGVASGGVVEEIGMSDGEKGKGYFVAVGWSDGRIAGGKAEGEGVQEMAGGVEVHHVRFR